MTLLKDIYIYTTLINHRSHHESCPSSSERNEQNLKNKTSTPKSASAVAAAAAAAALSGGAREPRQRGQVMCLSRIHLSRQSWWKTWEHLSSPISSPSSTSARQTAQCSEGPPALLCSNRVNRTSSSQPVCVEKEYWLSRSTSNAHFRLVKIGGK